MEDKCRMILEMTRPVQGGLRQERKLEIVANNLANADTAGFKKDSVSFDNKFKAQVNKDFSQGTLQSTGNPLDFALSDKGFFKVDTAEGIRYTRDGNFSLDADGILVDQNGNPVLGRGGPIAINGANADIEQELSVNQNGEIRLGNTIIDTFDIVTFSDLRKMKRDGKNLLSYEGNTTDEISVDSPIVQQGSLEKSNIHVVEEMVRMIDDHRMFETFTKSMMTFDEIDGRAINDVGKLR